jgi:hypothetical protein
MPSRFREISFAAFVTEQRPRLQGVAYLLHGNVLDAENVVDASLAQLYDSWPLIGNAEDAAFRRLLDVRLADLDLPWQRQSRIELVDWASARMGSNGIVGDLAGLQPDQRRAVVLELFAQLPILRIAGILDQGAPDVQRLARSAREQLVAWNPARADDAILQAELADAIPHDLRTALPAAIDLAHGRQLVRHRVGRRLAVTAAAVVALASVALWAPRASLSQEGSGPPVPMPSAAQPTEPPPCQKSDEACRIHVLSTWRSEIAEIVRSYVDPNRTYYAGYSYEAEPIYETRSFWQGRGGVLGVDLSPSSGNSTMIFIQVATADDLAIRCGQLTMQECFSHRFMDGNYFTLTETTDPTDGIEVQFTPSGYEVVTIVARDIRRGRSLHIGTGDLIKAVQDPRLRLPHG